MKQTMTLDFELPTLNEMIKDAKTIDKKTGWSLYDDNKRQYTDMAGVQAQMQLKPVAEDLRIKLKIKWFCKDKRKDPDNISGGGTKYILDGLISAGIIKNDGWREICEIRHLFIYDKEKPRIVVVLEG
jgi:Holliday junction resolvase RusA-like endonuclease